MLKFKELLQLFYIIAIELPLEVLGYLIVPIALAFCDKNSERLPKWARWFEDANDTYNGVNSAINGDSGWKKQHFKEPKNRMYFARLLWLYRNRIGYFSSRINGVKVSEIEPSSVRMQGNPRVTSNGGVISDFCKVTCKLKNGRTRFGLYKVVRYKGFLSGFYCRIYVGWKLMDICGMNEENKNTYLEADDKKVLKSVWAVNPLKRVQNER